MDIEYNLLGTKAGKLRLRGIRAGKGMVRVSILAARTLEDNDDPREGNGFEDRDVMNDRTKPDTASSQSVDPAKAKVGGPQQPEDRDDKVPNGKQRTRPSEPYLTWLGQSLRQSYEETLNEPVPDSFRELLNRLEQQDEDKPA